MPNWCSTSVKFSGPKKDLDFILKNLDELKSNSNDHGTIWLGDVLVKFGCYTKKEVEKGKLPFSYRGWIHFYEGEDGYITLDQEDAWNPHLMVWKEVVDKNKLDVNIIYTAIEPGMGIYISNDLDVVGNYSIDGELVGYQYNDDLYDCCAEEDDVISVLQDIFKTNVDDLNELLELASTVDDDTGSWLSINRYEYEDITS